MLTTSRLLVTAALFGGMGWAATISHQFNQGVSCFPCDRGVFFSFPAFDPALGTLESLDLSATVSGHLQLDFITFTPNASWEGTVTETSNIGFMTIPASGYLKSGNIPLPVFRGCGIGGNCNLGVAGSAQGSTSDPATLAMFTTATGPVLVNARLGTLFDSDVDNRASPLSPDVGLLYQFNLTYTYTPVAAVPEPGAIVLVFGGLVMVAYRKRKS